MWSISSFLCRSGMLDHSVFIGEWNLCVTVLIILKFLHRNLGVSILIRLSQHSFLSLEYDQSMVQAVQLAKFMALFPARINCFCSWLLLQSALWSRTNSFPWLIAWEIGSHRGGTDEMLLLWQLSSFWNSLSDFSWWQRWDSEEAGVERYFSGGARVRSLIFRLIKLFL